MTDVKMFPGERAVVTGAASNIGRAIARALAAEGAEVFLADVDAERLSSLSREIAATGGKARAVTVDLSGRDGYRTLLAALDGVPPPPSMLVHSASPRRIEADLAMTVSEETWDAMVNVNLRSGFFLAREVALRMKAAGVRGRLLFITSLHAETPRNLPHYAASKAGQTMVVKELARAFGPAGIRVNALAPGAVPGGGFNAAAQSFDGKIPLGRLGTAEDMTGMALALLSDRFSGYVTGTTVAVDGGLALYNWITPPA